MTNRVKNFSLNLSDSDVTGSAEDFKRENLRLGTIDVSVTASAAARFAEEGGYEVLAVQDGNRLEAVFFPGYLRDLLPHHPIGQHIGVREDMALSEIIEQIDEEGIDFHSERVNYYPTLWLCPEGHITSDDPCPRHAVATSPYP